MADSDREEIGGRKSRRPRIGRLLRPLGETPLRAMDRGKQEKSKMPLSRFTWYSHPLNGVPGYCKNRQILKTCRGTLCRELTVTVSVIDGK